MVYKELVCKEDTVVNLASKEYSKMIEPYLRADIRYISSVFGTLIDGKVKIKGTEAKMARGEMVRYMASYRVEEVKELKKFRQLGYQYCKELSDETTYIFLKNK